MKRWIFIATWLMLSAICSIQAQELRIQGVVVDAISADPLAGATIVLQGSIRGTSTDVQGRFVLTPLAGADSSILEISYLGYRKQIIKVPASQYEGLVEVKMVEDLARLSEVVISGQGLNTEKFRLSTQVTTISAKTIEEMPTSRLDQVLQSQLPNAQIRIASGQPNASSIFRSRGIVSAFINSTPIIYVDGVRVDNLNSPSNLGLNLSGNRHQGVATSALADIPVDNIERVEFINGGAATTLYGSDAANGVLQIFTKKGGAERTSVTLETELGAIQPTKDFLFFDRTADLLYQDGFLQRYSLGINGGKEGFGYSFSGGFFDNTGFRIHDQNTSRGYSFRTGFKAPLGNKLTYNSSFGFANQAFNRVRNGNAGGYTGLWFAEAGASSITGPRFDPKIDALSDADYQKMKTYVSLSEQLQDNTTSINRFQTSQNFELRPLPGLTIRATGGLDYRVSRETGVVTNAYLNHTRATAPGRETSTEGSISNYDRKFIGLTLEAAAQYRFNLGALSFISTLGSQLFRNEDQQIEYSGLNVRDGARTIAVAATRQSNEFFAEVANYGIYFQENIGFKNRYFLEFGVRGDGNSAFGDNIGTQYYPKVGFSYVLSNEGFMKRLEDILSYVKIRGNYGIAGNFPPPFSNERTIQFFGFLDGQAATFGLPGNKDLKPEKTTTLEGGIELGVLKDRITLGLSYYRSTTEDALFNIPPAPSTGESSVLLNIGEIENKGFEINANFVVFQTKNWDLRLRAAYNTLDNKVTDAGGAAPFAISGFSERTLQVVVQQGFPVGYLRGYRGTFAADGTLASFQPQQFLGSTLPESFGSAGINLRYKRLSFFANADFQTGASAHSFDRQFRFNYAVDNEGIPQAEVDKNKRVNWLNFTDRFVEKTDFFKVRIASLGYELPRNLLGGFIQRAQISFAVTNPLNFASSSFDPEATQSGGAQGQNSATTGGISYAVDSLPREFIASFKLNF